jgi:hypothetical protein
LRSRAFTSCCSCAAGACRRAGVRNSSNSVAVFGGLSGARAAQSRQSQDEPDTQQRDNGHRGHNDAAAAARDAVTVTVLVFMPFILSR